MYDQYKTSFFYNKPYDCVGLFYAIAYSQGYFGEVLLPLQVLRNETLLKLQEPWFYVSILIVPVFSIFTKKKRREFHRFAFYNPAKSFSMIVLAIMVALVALLISYGSFPHLASIYTLLFVIVVSSWILYTIFQRTFTVDESLFKKRYATHKRV